MKKGSKKERKNRQVTIRIGPKETEMLEYLTMNTYLSMSDIFRIGLKNQYDLMKKLE
ncbi:MAG: hypothetical protein Q4C65_02510 [Eubacteriales bacterium]|nr:hypothetical protein [Eubacteriales bacterium]